MHKEDIDISLVDINSGKIYDGILEYNINENGTCKLNLSFISKKINVESTDCFEALATIRLEIFPIIPLINGSRIDCFPSAMSRQMSNGIVLYKAYLGHQAKEEDQVNIFDITQDIQSLGTVQQQKAYHRIWFETLGVDRYGIDTSFILIEKTSKFIYNPNKILNKNYQYFWIYDQENNKIYNIENKNDIEKFKNGEILPQWNSFHVFLEYYANNWCCPARNDRNTTPLKNR